jgi:hypothetical protein
MKSIDNLSSVQGRKILRKIYNELKYEKQRSAIPLLIVLWKIAAFEKQLNKYSSEETTVQMPLGFFSGTVLWMEEIVNRYYFSTVNSFVYFGAAILLVLIGVRRFSQEISINLVIAGIIFEAILLLFMFVVMLFSPADYDDEFEASEYSKADELLDEIGEIGKEFASSVIQMEKLTESLNSISSKQSIMIDKLDEIVRISSDAVRPNPEMLDTMKDTNIELKVFKDNISQLKDIAAKIKNEDIAYQVRKEIENILSKKLDEKTESK